MTLSLAENPIHLGLGGRAVAQPAFTGIEWYEDYANRTAADGTEGRRWPCTPSPRIGEAGNVILPAKKLSSACQVQSPCISNWPTAAPPPSLSVPVSTRSTRLVYGIRPILRQQQHACSSRSGWALKIAQDKWLARG